VERQRPEDLDDPVGPTTERDSPVESEGPEPVEAIEPEGAELVEAAEDEVLPIEPPPPTTARGDLVNLHDADRAPTTLNRTPPDYPMTSRRMKHAGTVVLNVLVDENGAVDEVEIIRGVSNELNEAAVRAVKSWTYEPAEKDGVAVKVWKPEKVAFKL
jgi:TonB family protein